MPPRTFQFRCVEALPRLAWCAVLRPGEAQATVLDGPAVEVRGDCLVEGARSGARHDRRIHPIAVSPEMQPWSIGGRDDRPLPRRGGLAGSHAGRPAPRRRVWKPIVHDRHAAKVGPLGHALHWGVDLLRPRHETAE